MQSPPSRPIAIAHILQAASTNPYRIPANEYARHTHQWQREIGEYHGHTNAMLLNFGGAPISNNA